MTGDSNVCRQVLITLRRIIRGIDLHSRTLVRDYGLTAPQLILMEELARLSEVSMGDLAKGVNLSHATVTDVVVRLEKRGFVKRSGSESDKRRVLVRITDLGLEILKNAPPLLEKRFVDQFEKLEDWEQSLILSSLQRVASMMEVKEFGVSTMLVSESISPTGEESAELSPDLEQSLNPL